MLGDLVIDIVTDRQSDNLALETIVGLLKRYPASQIDARERLTLERDALVAPRGAKKHAPEFADFGTCQIESGKEEMYRLAEREVNSYLTLIKQQNIRNWTDQDYLSMTALKFAIANVGMRQSRELDSEDLRRLEAIGEEIDSCLNDPTR